MLLGSTFEFTTSFYYTTGSSKAKKRIKKSWIYESTYLNFKNKTTQHPM